MRDLPHSPPAPSPVAGNPAARCARYGHSIATAIIAPWGKPRPERGCYARHGYSITTAIIAPWGKPRPERGCYARHGYSIATAIISSLVALISLAPRPVYAYNCVNVVLRDPYWGQYRAVIERGQNAAGIGNAFARSGFTVDNVPLPGDIMVWPAGYYGASSTGHVGIVVAIEGNGTVLVRHENWPYGTPEHLQTFTVRPAHQFVHRPIIAAPADEPAAGMDGDEPSPA